MSADGYPDQYQQALAELKDNLRTATQRKLKAQELLMHGIANVLGYWTEEDLLLVAALGGDDQREEFGRLLRAQADRIAKLFGYDEAWGA